MTDGIAGLGRRLNAERLRQNRSQRDLARSLGVSASLISQIEAGKVQPSVATLMAIVSELDLSIDELLRGIAPDDERTAAHAPVTSTDSVGRDGDDDTVDVPTAIKALAGGARTVVGLRHNALQNVEHRESIVLSSGVTWERLTPAPDDHVDFILVTYPPGASSSDGEQMLTHSGKEYWYVLSGHIRVRLVFDEFEAGPEDSFVFECTLPHRFYNAGDVDARAVVMIVHNVA